MNEVTKVLVGALKLFRGGKGWITGDLSRNNSNGEEDRYCALGAISKAASGECYYPGSVGNNVAGAGAAKEAAKLLSTVVGNRSIPGWNDSTRGLKGWAKVKAGFCEAIKQSIEMDKTIKKPTKKARKRAA